MADSMKQLSSNPNKNFEFHNKAKQQAHAQKRLKLDFIDSFEKLKQELDEQRKNGNEHLTYVSFILQEKFLNENNALFSQFFNSINNKVTTLEQLVYHNRKDNEGKQVEDAESSVVSFILKEFLDKPTLRSPILAIMVGLAADLQEHFINRHFRTFMEALKVVLRTEEKPTLLFTRQCAATIVTVSKAIDTKKFAKNFREHILEHFDMFEKGYPGYVQSFIGSTFAKLMKDASHDSNDKFKKCIKMIVKGAGFSNDDHLISLQVKCFFLFVLSL
eukprot:TRINITY_DN4_c0_g7_i1.p1 TRINITY_DN4_c0_g7~~TRINITY_DN4_c0_g7_i1.p1  ORF type:complete len:274 (+),score=69.93 TRINITY_DN4_c0_g7_i1:82-903(+)